MKQLIHDTVTSIKYLYPCIAYDEECSETELVIITETKVSKLYPIILSVKGMKHLGDDFWGRPTFVDEKEQYFCELDGELYFKGKDMDGEPHWPVTDKIEYTMPDVDKDFAEFQPCIEKVKSFVKEKTKMEFLEATPSIKINNNDILESKIICRYRFKL